MSSVFVPVDLDQLLDEFEEQEKNHHESLPISRPDSLDLPHSLQDGQLKLHSLSDPRTYSFNSPLDAILKEQSNNIDKAPRKSLAEELADFNLGMPNDDDDIDDDDGIDAGSDASSTTAVIAAAEKITSENDFPTSDSTCSASAILDNREFIDENNGSLNFKPNHESSDRKYNDIEVDETDFLSLLNSVVEVNPFCVKGSKPTSDNVMNDSILTEISNEMKSSSQEEISTNFNPSNSTDTSTTECSDATERNCSHNVVDAELVTIDDNLENHHGAFISDEIDVNHMMKLYDESLKEVHSGEVHRCISPEMYESSNISQDDTTYTHAVSNPIESYSSVLNTVVAEDNDDSHVEPSHTELNIQQNDLFVNKNDDMYFPSTLNDGTQYESSCVATLEDSSLQVNDHHTAQHEPSLVVPTQSNDVPSLYNQMIAVDNSSADSLCGLDERTGCDENIPTTLPEDDAGLQTSPPRAITPEPQLVEGLAAVHISSGDPEMGFVPPIWVPDEVATHCMTCGLKFSLIKRKHHCRGCGKVLCSSCCNMKYPLPYLGNKDARVCQVCCDILIQGHQQNAFIEGLPEDTLATEDHPRLPDNNDETPVVDNDSPFIETEHVHSEQVLDSSEMRDESPVEDDFDQEDQPEAGPSDIVITPPVLSLSMDPTGMPQAADSGSSLTSAPLSPTLSDDSDMSFRLDIEHVRAIIPQDSFTLPPVLNLRKKAIHIQEHPDPAEIMYRLKGLGDTVIFMLNKNLIVKVTIVKLRCCVKKKCWVFVTDGMGAANQEEMVVLLECEHSENTVPKDVLSHFNTAFTYAKQGHVVSDLGFTIFGQPFLGSSNNAGFLYIKPTFQCLDNLPLPSVPYVVGVLIQRQEAPWAQLFPIRLMLRLGTEFRYYPCPLWSVRNRPSVYHEIGHTIMNLLTDFKNFQYSIPRVTGLVIHMEDTKTTVRLPQDRFDEMIKVLNASEEHMFAFGANFSTEADSHLVCIQEGENYKTQAINIQNKTRKVTGASFVVFTGSLKTSNPNDAKVSIIEDGIMIQMLPDAVLELRKALREMQDYVIKTGSSTSGNAVTQVNVEWVTRDTNKQTHISPIDGRSLTDVPSIQVHSSCDFSKRDIYRIRWTNVFLERNGHSSRGLSSRGLSRLTGELARSCCEALRPHLLGLFEMDLTRLSLRVNIDTDSVEYSIGAKQQPLPANLMADLDSALIPSINAAAMKHRRGPLTVELFFSVVSLF